MRTLDSDTKKLQKISKVLCKKQLKLLPWREMQQKFIHESIKKKKLKKYKQSTTASSLVVVSDPKELLTTLDLGVTGACVSPISSRFVH